MDEKRGSFEFISIKAGLAWHGSLLKGIYFIWLLELQANNPSKYPVAQVLSNPINIFLITTNIILFCSFP